MIKLTVYLKSGQTIKFKCEAYRFDYEKTSLEYCGYEIRGSIPKVNLVPSQVAAYVVG